jgi:hypothetical protein
MWFNNRFNRDNTIHFVPSEWTCTDPDEGQFCRVISKTEFEYIQIKDMSGKEHSKKLLDTLNDKTTINDWYQDEIDIRDYDADQLGREVAPYGEILDGVEDEQDRNQLMAECIFENNLTCGDYDY